MEPTTRRGRSRQAIAAIAAATVLVAALGGVAWAVTVTKGKKIDLAASYTIRVALGEAKEQVLFRVGDVTVATECTAWEDTGCVFMVGGKSITVTNNGPDTVLLVVGEVVGPVEEGTRVHPLLPGEGEAFGVIGGAATNDAGEVPSGTGGRESFALLDRGGVSASGSMSFWYDAPDEMAPGATGTCVITAQLRG